ncbi:integrase [Methyloversatilis discipulorum]|uniref:integrase n=1 Tax=Methyloversatilis discipulorum TaxID=1119528 RepID=UPI003F2F05CD
MLKTLEFIACHLPRVTANEVLRFSDTVEIRDAQAFAAELEAFVQERLESVELPSSIEIEVETVEQTLARKAAALRADIRWTPGETEIQRGRAAMLEAFEQSHNLPLPDFARLANKSRQQIYKDIDAQRLLALNVGRRGQRLPDWQLDPVKQRLTQAVLQGAPGLDPWTLYRALSEPLEGLDGRSPAEAVAADSVDAVAKAVFNVLGVELDSGPRARKR